jgi:hypothetical protein
LFLTFSAAFKQQLQTQADSEQGALRRAPLLQLLAPATAVELLHGWIKGPNAWQQEGPAVLGLAWLAEADGAGL